MKKMSAKVTAAILAASAVLSACGGSGSADTTAAAADNAYTVSIEANEDARERNLSLCTDPRVRW